MPEYSLWNSMRGRCNNPRDKAYARYGGRGITVCERWNVFLNFVADVGPRPSKAHSLDRIRNAEGYQPGNVRWATASQQQRNRRANHIIECGGERLMIVEWAERTGLKPNSILSRLRKGWSPEEAVSTPLFLPHERAPGRRRRQRS